MNFTDAAARKKALIEAARSKNQPTAEDAVIQRVREFINPSEAKSRTRIIFDNSGSMCDSLSINGQPSTKMKEAKKGVIEYLRNCALNKDAVAVHMLNAYSNYHEEDENKISDLIMNADLTTDLVRLASAMDNEALRPIGSTPLFERIIDALEAEPKATRLIAFSDGEANNSLKQGIAIAKAKSESIKIDTVFFGTAISHGARTMRELAEATGGIYLVFDPIKGVNFATAFKYLTEGNRKMLADKSFVEKLERGEIK